MRNRLRRIGLGRRVSSSHLRGQCRKPNSAVSLGQQPQMLWDVCNANLAALDGWTYGCASQRAIWRTIAIAVSRTMAVVDVIVCGVSQTFTALSSRKPMTVQSVP